MRNDDALMYILITKNDMAGVSVFLDAFVAENQTY